jgi:cytochrome bd-type quinol oxidase subunit 1
VDTPGGAGWMGKQVRLALSRQQPWWCHNLMQIHFPAPAHLPYSKAIAVGLLSIPALLLTALAVGEMAGGDVSGVQHVPEALARAVLALVAWRHPRRVGAILLVAGVILLAAWMGLTLSADRHDSGATLVLIAAMLFVPPLVAGWLLYTAGRRAATRRPRAGE